MSAFEKRDDLVAQFYTSRGGTYSDNYKQTGIKTDSLNHKLWLIAETSELANKGIDVLIKKLDKDLD